MIRQQKQVALAGLLLGTLFFTSSSWGIVNITDNMELEGFVNAKNVVRATNFSNGDLIMQRNTAQLEGKYYFLRDSTAFGRFSTGRLEEATLTVIGRSVYDSVYDLRDSYDGLEGKSESKIREVFVDMVLPPFTLRLGRQQVVWGETDNFRALDVINPLDLSWHWSQEPWEDIRIPLWMARGIVDIGKIGPFEETFVEAVWVPTDFESNKVDTDPRYPWAFYGAGLPKVADSVVIGDQLYDLDVTVRDLSPSRKLRNGQGGFRFKGIWGDIDFSLNYYYGFSSSPGVKVRSDLVEIDGSTLHTVVETVNPRTHVVGLTANYSEERFTQSVIRLEATVTKGIPISIEPGAPLGIDPEQDQFDTVSQSVIMLGLDRPTWIRPLNKLRTFFISTQFFWRRYLDYSSHYQGVSSVVPATIGGVTVPDRFMSLNNNTPDRDEFVITFAASTSYGRAGRWKPTFVFAYDPRSTGAFNKLSLEYLWSKHLIFNVQQNLYWRASGDEQGPWSIGDMFGRGDNRRNETVFNIIFQF